MRLADEGFVGTETSVEEGSGSVIEVMQWWRRMRKLYI